VDNGVYVYCKDVSATDSAYVTGKKLAADVALTLNGGSIQTSSQTYNVFLPPTTNNCYTDWDPLTILCGDPAVLQSPPPAVPASALQKCPPDPNRDGADAACYGGPLYAQSGNQAPASGQPSPGAIAAAGAAAGVAGGGGNARATSVGRPSPPQATRQRDRSARPAAVVADLSELANFSIGGRTASWGSTVTVGGAAGTPVAGGGCRIPVRHFVRNTGPGESGPFTTEWRSSGIRGQVTTSRESLGRGEFRQEMDDVVLIGPVNTLTLVLDPGNQVAESDESNNRYSVTIQLSGTCGARSRD
jgi:hypothetical protein